MVGSRSVLVSMNASAGCRRKVVGDQGQVELPMTPMSGLIQVNSELP